MRRSTGGLLLAALAAIACTPQGSTTRTATEAPAPAATARVEGPITDADTCRAPATPTLAQTEGPFFRPGAPERTRISEPSAAGRPLVLEGRVLTRACEPVAHARIDFWQTDAQGRYDNAGFTLRGHQRTDTEGRYRLETIHPGEYPGRTPHLHVKVTRPDGRELTSQLYFPDLAERNARDRIYRAALLVRYVAEGHTDRARFDLILD